MASKIKRKESALHAVRRVGRCLTKKSLGALKDCDTLEAVHEIRKNIKHIRALLRLVQSGVSRRDRSRLTKTLRKAASILAPSRDAFIKTSALAGLTSHFKRELPSSPFQGISRVLTQDCRKEQKKLPSDLKRTRRLLKKICRNFRSMDAGGAGWKLIAPGIRRSYRDGRRASHLAEKTGAPEDFHEWRKSAKDLLYQVSFLCGIWPEQMNALETDLDRLGDALGDAHDFAVLASRETIKRLAQQPKREIETLKTLTARRQKELHAKALRFGARLYHEKSAPFCRRLHGYWRRWRNGRVNKNSSLKAR